MYFIVQQIAIKNDELNKISIFFLFRPFNSHEWPILNFPLHYRYNIKQTNDENKE